MTGEPSLDPLTFPLNHRDSPAQNLMSLSSAIQSASFSPYKNISNTQAHHFSSFQPTISNPTSMPTTKPTSIPTMKPKTSTPLTQPTLKPVTPIPSPPKPSTITPTRTNFKSHSTNIAAFDLWFLLARSFTRSPFVHVSIPKTNAFILVMELFAEPCFRPISLSLKSELSEPARQAGQDASSYIRPGRGGRRVSVPLGRCCEGHIVLLPGRGITHNNNISSSKYCIYSMLPNDDDDRPASSAVAS
jgi:hypothetical protein